MPRKRPWKKYARDYRDRKRAKGLCVKTGCWQPSGDTDFCESCRITNSVYSKKYYAEKREIIRKAREAGIT